MKKVLHYLIFLLLMLTGTSAFAQSTNYNTWEILPLYGLNTNAGALAPSAPESLMVFGTDKFYRSFNGAYQWEEMSGITGFIENVFVHSTHSDSVFVNGQFGINISGDFGATWTFLYTPQNANFDDFAMSTTQTNIMYGADMYNGKIYRSLDQGKNWTLVWDNANKYIYGLDISQQHPNIVFFCLYDSIYRSNDYGNTWKNITNNFYDYSGNNPTYLAVSPYDENLIISFTYSRYIKISYDGGNSWQTMDMGKYISPRKAIFSPDNQSIYIATGGQGIYFSSDRGNSWSPMSTNGLMNKNIVDVLLNPHNSSILYALTYGNGVFKSTDGGVNWLPYNQNITGIGIERVAESPTNSNLILAATSFGGVYRSINGGKNWAIVNNGLSDLQIKDLIWSPAQPSKIFLLTAHDGFFISEDNGSSWIHRQQGNTLDYSYGMTSDSVSGRIYVSGSNSNNSPIIYSDDWGQTWNYFTVPTDFPKHVYDIAYNYLNASLYVATETELYKFDGMSWVNLSGTFFTDEGRYPHDIVLHPSTVDTLYVSAGGGIDALYRGTNGGTNWEPLVDYFYGQEIFIDPSRPNIQYILGIYKQKSFDNGITWKEIYNKGTLPWLNVHGGDLSYHNHDIIYLNSYSGLYRMHQAAELSTTSTVNFGTISVGDSATQQVILTNNGNSYLEISNLQIEGIHSSHWKIVNPPSSIIKLALNESDTIYVRFNPDSVSDLSAKITATTNDPLTPSLQITLSGTGAGGLLSLPFSNLDFGNVYVNTSQDTTVTVTNNGNTTLKVSALNISGTNAAPFQIISGNAPFTVDPAQQHSIKLRFTPSSTSNFSATLNFQSNDVYKPNQSISLAGKGVAADIDLAGTTTINFGTVYIGNYVDQNFQIRNYGDADLIISNMVISDTSFKVVSPSTPITIAPGQNRQISLRFQPSEVNNYNSKLKIYSNDPDENPVTVNLVGTCSNVPTGLLVLSQNEQNFGDVIVGEKSTTWELVVSNSSTLYDFQIDSITINNSAFVVMEKLTFPYQVNPGFSFPLHIYFQPDTVKNYQGLLTFYSNASNGTQQVNLSGSGISKPTGKLELSSNSIDFDKVPINANSDTVQITLSNTDATHSVQIDSMVIGDAAFRILGSDTLNFPVNIGAKKVLALNLIFQPTEQKTYSSDLRIYSNASNGVLQTVSLTGQGILPTGTIALSSDSVYFGIVLVNSTSNIQSLTISNSSSNYNFTIDSLKISPDLFQYQFNYSLPYSLQPQEQVTVNLSFTPNDSGAFNGDLYIYSDASNNNMLRVKLQGKGKYPEPPQITFNPGNVSGTLGNNAPLSLTLNSDLPIVFARVFYHSGGKTTYDSLNLSSSDGKTYSVSLPANLLTERGLAYFFKISDGQHSLRYPAKGEFNLPIKVPNLERAIAGDGSYQMISIPLQLNDASPLSVLSDNLGEYNIYKWRLFRWIDGAYIELNDPDKDIGSFEPGTAFWLAAKSATSFNTGSGQSTPVADSIVISLQKGWNQIGNPYAFPVAWSSVAKEGNVASDLWKYDTDKNGFQLSAALQPWEGYFVKALNANSKLIFYPIEANLPKPLAKQEVKDGWRVRIKMQSANFNDNDNFVGMANKAEAQYDSYDHFEPPMIGDYASLYFPRPEWNIPGRYSADVRPMSENGDSWEFVACKSKGSKTVNLSFDYLGNFPPDYEIWLWDQRLNIPVDLKNKDRYKVDFSQNEKERRFRLLIGKSSYINNQFSKLDIYPNQLTLYPNYPNPFNPETMIKFGLPSDDQVSLVVYNLRGQIVRKLVSNKMFTRGYHALTWDGRNDRGAMQSSGIYFAVLKVAKAVKVMKMTLIR